MTCLSLICTIQVANKTARQSPHHDYQSHAGDKNLLPAHREGVIHLAEAMTNIHKTSTCHHCANEPITPFR